MMAVALKKFVLFFLVGFCTCYKLPTSFTKCDRKQGDFPECLTKAVGDALKLLKEPLPELGLYLEPLELPFIYGAPGGKIITFHQYLKSLKIWGFSNANCSKVDMNFETKNLTIECSIPELVALTEYHYIGKIYDLPFNEFGPAMFTHRDVQTHLSFLLEEYTKKELKYFVVARNKFIMESGSIHIFLGNLFKGDRERSQKLNQNLNENALEIFNEVKQNYEPIIGNQFAIFFNNILGNISVDELFGDE